MHLGGLQSWCLLESIKKYKKSTRKEIKTGMQIKLKQLIQFFLVKNRRSIQVLQENRRSPKPNLLGNVLSSPIQAGKREKKKIQI